MSLILYARFALEDLVSGESLITLVAVTTVAMGCLRLLGAFEVEARTGHRWTVGGLMLGTVEVVLGVVLFLAHDASATTLRVVIGVWGITAGILLLTQAARIRKAGRLEAVLTEARRDDRPTT